MKTPEQIQQNIEEDGVHVVGRALNPIMNLFQIEIVFPDFSKANNILKRLYSKPEFFVVENCVPGKSCNICNKNTVFNKDINKSVFIDFTVKFTYNTIEDIKNKFVELFNILFDPTVKDLTAPNFKDIIVTHVKKDESYDNDTVKEKSSSSFITTIKNLIPGIVIIITILILVCYFLIKGLIR